jgi:MFS family permease
MGGVTAAACGPVLGGLLSLVSWRLIFFVNVPAGAVALVLLARAVRAPGHGVPFDWAGQAAAVAGMGGLTYGAIEAGAAGITAPRVVAALAVAVAALAAFGVLQARGRHPMLPLSLFRSRTVSVAVATGFAVMVGYYGLPFVMSLYLQQLRGLSALGTGVAFLPMMLTGAVLTPFTARLAGRFGAHALVTAGLLAMTAGLAVVALMPAPAPIEVGGALAVAVFGALLADRSAFLAGLRVSLLIAVAVVLAAAGVSLLLRPDGARDHGREPDGPAAATGCAWECVNGFGDETGRRRSR